jgi:hypothetical protein
MSKWVVLFLMALAFVAGGLSFYKMGQLATPSPTAQGSGRPAPSTTTTPDLVPSPQAATPVALASRTIKGPNFGPPPGTKNQPVSGATPPTSGPQTATNVKPSLVTGEIRAYVFSTKPGGDARTRFPKTSGPIYLTVSPVGMRDSTELVASIRSAMDEKASFSEPVQSSGPPRLRTFRFAPPKEGWISGAYQVIVRPAQGEQVLTQARFEIDPAEQPTPIAMPTPQYLNLMTDLSDPSRSRSVFSQSDAAIHLVVDSAELPPGTSVRSVWSVVEVERLTPGELFAATESTPGTDQDALFTFVPSKEGFLPGSYRVDVYFDQQRVGNQAFFIQPAEEVASTPSPQPSTP